MTRPPGRVDVDEQGRLVLRRPAGSDTLWWKRAVRSLTVAADLVNDEEVHVSPTRTPALRRLLSSGAAAGADWHWTPKATEVAQSAEQVTRSLRHLLSRTVDEQAIWPSGLNLADLGFTRQLRPFQRIAVARLLAADGGANFSIPGSGKTAVAYAVWTALRSTGRAHGMIVVAPLSAFEAWTDEAKACFTPEGVPTVRIRPGRLANSDDVVVINYERLSETTTLAAIRAWAKNRKVLVVYDEAHRAKAGAASQRGAAAADLARAADASMVLTGTPMPNGKSDLAAVFDLAWPGHGQRLVDGDLAHIRDRAFVRATKRDLDLPPVDLRLERVALDPVHRRVYEAMADSVADWAGRPEATAAEAGQALMRLIAAATNPAAVFAPGAPWALADDVGSGAELADVLADPSRHIRAAKIVRAAQIVTTNRSNGRKSLVWSNFVDNVRVIGEALAHHHPAIVVGATPVDNPSAPSDRTRELYKFRNDPSCWVLVATPQTLGEGVSLHRTCTDQVHVDRGYSAATWLQSIDRTHRLGLAPDAQVTCTIIEAEDTIDSRITDVLNAKVATMADALYDASLRPVADPTTVLGDPVAAILGDLDALRELLAVGTSSRRT